MKRLISFSELKKDCRYRDYGWCNRRCKHCQLCTAKNCPIWKKLPIGISIMRMPFGKLVDDYLKNVSKKDFLKAIKKVKGKRQIKKKKLKPARVRGRR